MKYLQNANFKIMTYDHWSETEKHKAKLKALSKKTLKEETNFYPYPELIPRMKDGNKSIGLALLTTEQAKALKNAYQLIIQPLYVGKNKLSDKQIIAIQKSCKKQKEAEKIEKQNACKYLGSTTGYGEKRLFSAVSSIEDWKTAIKFGKDSLLKIPMWPDK